MVTGPGGEIKVGRRFKLSSSRSPAIGSTTIHAPPGRPCRPCREETVEEGGEIEAGLRIILRDADLEPRVCADPRLIGPKPWPTAEAMELNSAISRHLIYRAIYILTQLAAPGVRRGINPPARPGDYRRGHQRYRDHVTYQALRAKADGDAEDAEPSEKRADVE